MPFPPSARVLYKRNPLKEVICQLRFPPVLEIASEPPTKFQNRVRKTYPLYEEENPQIPAEMGDMGRQLGIRLGSEGTAYKFLTEDSQRFISLSSGYVAVTDHSYKRWESFRDEVELACSALQIHEPAFYTRVGLRYRDVIDRREIGMESSPWEVLLRPDLIGLVGLPEVAGTLDSIKNEASIKIDDVPGGEVTLRHGYVTTPDGGRDTYIIDVDLYTGERSRCDDVLGILDVFHDISGNLFRWAISPELHSALGPTEIGEGPGV